MKIISALLSVLLSASILAQTPLHYEMVLDSGKARVQVQLPVSVSHAPYFYSPAVEMGLISQVHNVTCEGKPLLLQKPGVWQVPKTCKKVSWELEFLPGKPDQIDAARQESLYIEGAKWWLIATPTALLKLDGYKEEAKLTVYGPNCTQKTDAELYKGSLPYDWQAPEFIAIDPCHQHQRKSLMPGLRFIVDNPARFEKLNLEKRYAPIFTYLTHLTGAHNKLVTSPITIIWLGRDASLGAIGGAAGHHSFVANYLVGTDLNKKEEEAAHTLMVVAHEQFHQLTGLVRHHTTPLPMWINESLAQYYALKALRTQAIFTSTTLAKIEKPFLSSPSATLSLLDVEKRYKKERQLYSLFYTQGSAFWHQVDQLIQEETGENLDHYLPRLLQTEFIADGGQRETWNKVFKGLPAKTINRIVHIM
jgi:hypothetical protein